MSLTKLNPEQRLERLSRDDKWYLSTGDGILWAPAFPVWLHTPGFWDEAHVYYHPFAPLFGVALVGADGREIPLRQTLRRWRPDRLIATYGTSDGRVLTETREALGRGVFASTWSAESSVWQDLSRQGSHLVAFTAQPGDQITDAARDEATGGVRWRRTLKDRREQSMEIDATLSAASVERGTARPLAGARVAAVRSEGSAVQPVWRFTPFPERWSKGLRPEVRLEGINNAGLVYAAVDVSLAEAGTGGIRFNIELLPVEAAHRLLEASRVGSSGEHWQKCLGEFPTFRCSDPFLEKYYDYRIYGLRLCRLEGGAGNVAHPCVAEGISYFHVPITYSGQCHMLEMRWASDPGTARGTLLNFLDTQKDDGSFHGRIYTNHLIGTDFYLGSWGDVALSVDAVHPDREYLQHIYPGLAKYARWMDSTRDPSGCGMYEVLNHFETGQEYMSRYQSVNPRADEDGWKTSSRLQGIDATVYGYLLHRGLARIANVLGETESEWRERSDRIGTAIGERMWDAASGMFSDVDPKSGKRTGVQAAVCFYPLLTDLVSDAQIDGMLRCMEDPRGFATPYPLPSSAVSDQYFNADAEWKGKRHVCPWNGRVWPMTNSHVIDGLIRQWRRRDPDAAEQSPRARCGAAAGNLLGKFIHMMFHDGDLARPNCFEHYNPMTGQACEYRGIDDYQHSWVLDLIIRGIMGVDPGVDGRSTRLVIDPLPLPDLHAEIDDVRVAGQTLSIRRAKGPNAPFEVEFRGRRHSSVIGKPVTLEL